MRLSDYQWSGNPRGLHVASAFQTPMEYDRYTRIGAGWVKLVAAGTEYVDDAMWFLANGITPIVRLYRGTMWAEGCAWSGVGRYVIGYIHHPAHRASPPLFSSLTMMIALRGHSTAQMPQPLQ